VVFRGAMAQRGIWPHLRDKARADSWSGARHAVAFGRGEFEVCWGEGEVSARTILMVSAVTVLSSAPTYGQEASRDRAELDAAAGRRVFENVLLADPNAFSRRARVAPVQSFAALERPAATGEASIDRVQFDAAAGRTVSTSPARVAGQARAKEEAANARPVRVILGSPYGR
jgi:hypothetical protein